MPHRRRAGGLPDALQDLVHPDRLRDVALRAEQLRLPLEPVRGEDQDRDRGALRVAAHPLHDAPPVEHGHLQVEQDDARRLVGDALQRDLAVLGLLHRVTGVDEDLGEGLAEVVVVVDDEDVLARRHGALGSARRAAAISPAMRRASAIRSGASETAPTTGWPPPPYRSHSLEMSCARGGRAHGFDPTDTFARFGSRDTTTV